MSPTLLSHGVKAGGVDISADEGYTADDEVDGGRGGKGTGEFCVEEGFNVVGVFTGIGADDDDVGIVLGKAEEGAVGFDVGQRDVAAAKDGDGGLPCRRCQWR